GSAAAHDLFLKARNLMQSSGVNAARFHTSMELLAQALAIDPDYADAYAARALTHQFDYQNRWSDDPDGAVLAGRQDAEKAVALAPDAALGHFALGIIASMQRDYGLALASLDRAIELNPNDPRIMNSHGAFAIFTGKPADAVPHLERAIRLDPGFSQQ